MKTSLTHRSRIALSAIGMTALSLIAACSSSATTGTNTSDLTNSSRGAIDVPGAPASKIDLLFVTDDSGSMDTKSALVAPHVGKLLRSIAPNHDVHVGVITTSIVSDGLFGKACAQSNGATNARFVKGNVARAASGFLSYDGSASLDDLVGDTQALLSQVGDTGCGLEASLESAYRFLVQPDPWKRVTLDAGQAVYDGVDDEILAQRAAFLRPDSLVMVVLVTDEDDASLDPRALGGRGYTFGEMAPSFHATSACATQPGSADCTSCGYASSDPQLASDPDCADGGRYVPQDDTLNVRFSNMKQRFGLDPRFPLQRYISGFSDAHVPNRDTEHLPVDTSTPETTKPLKEILEATKYRQDPTCTNPLFAAKLPTSSSEELCHLPEGPRSRDLVVFSTLAGVPEGLVSGPKPNWPAMLGQDPEGYDLSGIDPHMIPSIAPRAGLPGPAALGDNGTDPVHGREYDTKGDDLQYACTFALPKAEPATPDAWGDCSNPEGTAPPVCDAKGDQTRGKAYPGVRPLMLARALGGRGLVTSVCATNSDYTAQMERLASFAKARLTP